MKTIDEKSCKCYNYSGFKGLCNEAQLYTSSYSHRIVNLEYIVTIIFAESNWNFSSKWI